MISKPFTSLSILPNFDKGHVISWSIDPTIEISKSHTFKLQTSGSPMFEEIIDEKDVGNVFFATDISNLKQSVNADIYYRVKLVDLKDNSEYFSDAIAFLPKKYDRRSYVCAREIARKEILRFKIIGTVAALLKRKIYGVHLNDDVDPISGIPLTDNTTSQGTSFETGYYDPLIMMVSIEDMQQVRKLSADGFGILDATTASMRTVGFPIIETYDIIVDILDDRRYVIKEVEKIDYPSSNITVIQILKVQLLPPTDPVYKIKIPNVQL